MPSRKRAKGKARKAKAQASNCNLILHNESVCRHGCEVISKDDICYKFVEQFEVVLLKVVDCSLSLYGRKLTVFEMFSASTAVLAENNEFRVIDTGEETDQKLSSLYVNLGVNLLLKNKDDRSSLLSNVVAVAALSSSYGFDSSTIMRSRKSRDIIRDLDKSEAVYDSIKFFHKKIPCQCLKKMYLREKSEPKLMSCDSCKVMKERSQLFLCSGCLYCHYCSSQCQRMHWPSHQEQCQYILK